MISKTGFTIMPEIVTKMGGDISAHGKLQGCVFLSVSVNHDRTYEKTRRIMNALHRMDKNKVLEIIEEEF